MNKDLKTAIILFAVQLAAFPIVRVYDLYSRFGLTDVLLHVEAGIMFGFLWLWLTRHVHMPKQYKYFTLIMFAVFGSLLWEYWEYYGHFFITPDLTRNYIPELADSLTDIASGFMGAVILCVFSEASKKQ